MSYWCSQVPPDKSQDIHTSMNKIILGLVAATAVAAPLAMSAPANAATANADGSVTVTKGDIQSAMGWNNAAWDSHILSDGVDTRMRMYGAPTGYEFVGLVEAIIVAGTGKIELDPETMKWIQAVDKPTHIQVFSTPT